MTLKAHEYIRAHLTAVDVNPTGLNKTAFLTTLCHELAVINPAVRDTEELITQVLKREAIESTGTGYGLAFPHARTEAVSAITLTIARIPAGLDYGAIDGQPVRIVILMAVPTIAIQPYLRILSHLLKRLRQKSVQKAVMEAAGIEELRTILSA